MKYVSLFAGIGGFDLALNRLGHECVYVNEWDKYSAITYEKNFKHKPDTRDITTVRTDEIPDHELLVGGFPCQSFSIAGLRRGFEDTRGTLFFDIARILQHKRPRYFILENVKGLLSHDEGKTFQTILGVLSDLGYDYQWQVLNSKNFGVPQNRERVFIVGHIRGEPRPQVFPIRGFNEKSKNLKQVGNVDTIGHNSLWGRVYDTNGTSSTLNAHGGGLGAKTGLYAIPLKFLERNQKNLQGNHSYTVDTMNSGGIMQDFIVRKLTPVECERLQGFPDNWTAGLSDSIRYKQLGNAVTVNVIYEIVKRIAD